MDSYEELCHFIRTVSERSGVRHFVMHARKCLLSGLSPAQNRTVPPLRCVLGASWTTPFHVRPLNLHLILQQDLGDKKCVMIVYLLE